MHDLRWRFYFETGDQSLFVFVPKAPVHIHDAYTLIDKRQDTSRLKTLLLLLAVCLLEVLIAVSFLL